MRIFAAFCVSLILAACSGDRRDGWQPSGNTAYHPSASASDTMIRSGITADSYDATLAQAPSLASDADAAYVGMEIRAHDENGKNLDQEVAHRLERQF